MDSIAESSGVEVEGALEGEEARLARSGWPAAQERRSQVGLVRWKVVREVGWEREEMLAVFLLVAVMAVVGLSEEEEGTKEVPTQSKKRHGRARSASVGWVIISKEPWGSVRR